MYEYIEVNVYLHRLTPFDGSSEHIEVFLPECAKNWSNKQLTQYLRDEDTAARRQGVRIPWLLAAEFVGR